MCRTIGAKSAIELYLTLLFLQSVSRATFYHTCRSTGEDTRFAGIKLSDLKVLATLGIGGFGRVELVSRINLNTFETFFEDIINECPTAFNLPLVTDIISKQKVNCLVRHSVSENLLCQINLHQTQSVK